MSMETIKSANTEPEQKPRGLWWQNFTSVTTLSALISAFVGVGTWLTNYSVEHTKLGVEEASREDKLQTEQRARLDKIAADEQALRTKYVDMALGQTLCVDYRVRIFGYLSAVLTDPAQKVWAVGERNRAARARDTVAELRAQLDKKREQSVNRLADLTREFGKGTWAQPVITAFDTEQKAIKSEIEQLQKRISDAEGPPCTAGMQAGPKPPG
jgi:hypothetical protein